MIFPTHKHRRESSDNASSMAKTLKKGVALSTSIVKHSANLRPRHLSSSHDRDAGERQDHPPGDHHHQSKRRAGYHGARPLQLSPFLELDSASLWIACTRPRSVLRSVDGSVSRAKIPFCVQWLPTWRDESEKFRATGGVGRR